MKSTRNLITAGILLMAVFFFSSCKKTSVDPVTQVTPATPVIPKYNIALIYRSDSTNAASLKALLQEADCSVDLVEQQDAAAKSYTAYKLIIIDHNTETTPASGYWTTGNTAAINASGKPMLLIGIGGLRFAARIGNIVNYGAGAQLTTNNFVPADKTMALFHKPYAITIPTSTPKVTLYAGASLASGQFVSAGTVLPDVQLLGNFSGFPENYPLTTEKDRYTTFGFYNPVDQMTTDGKNFMVNLCYYAGGFNK